MARGPNLHRVPRSDAFLVPKSATLNFAQTKEDKYLKLLSSLPPALSLSNFSKEK